MSALGEFGFCGNCGKETCRMAGVNCWQCKACEVAGCIPVVIRGYRPQRIKPRPDPKPLGPTYSAKDKAVNLLVVFFAAWVFGGIFGFFVSKAVH